MELCDFSHFLNSLSGCELILLASLISISIAKDLDDEELNILGNFLSSLGANLCTISSAGGLCK